MLLYFFVGCILVFASCTIVASLGFRFLLPLILCRWETLIAIPDLVYELQILTFLHLSLSYVLYKSMFKDLKFVLICFPTMLPSGTNCHLHCVYLLMLHWAPHFTICSGVLCVYHLMLHWAPHFWHMCRSHSIPTHIWSFMLFLILCYLNCSHKYFVFN